MIFCLFGQQNTLNKDNNQGLVQTSSFPVEANKSIIYLFWEAGGGVVQDAHRFIRSCPEFHKNTPGTFCRSWCGKYILLQMLQGSPDCIGLVLQFVHKWLNFLFHHSLLPTFATDQKNHWGCLEAFALQTLALPNCSWAIELLTPLNFFAASVLTLRDFSSGCPAQVVYRCAKALKFFLKSILSGIVESYPRQVLKALGCFQTGQLQLGLRNERVYK